MKDTVVAEELREIEVRFFAIKLVYPLVGIIIYIFSSYFGVRQYANKTIIYLTLIYLLVIVLSHYLASKVRPERILWLNFVLSIISACFVSVLIHFTGGPISPLFVLYFLIILNMGVFRSSFLSVVTAAICFVIYFALLLLELKGMLPVELNYVRLPAEAIVFHMILATTIFIFIGLHAYVVVSNLSKERESSLLLREASVKLTSKIGDEEEVVSSILEIGKSVTGGDCSSILEYREGKWKFLSYVNIEENLIKSIEESFVSNEPENLALIRTTGNTYFLRDTRKSKSWVQMSPTKSYIGVPILVEEDYVAVLNIDSFRPNKFTTIDVLNAKALAKIVGEVLQKERLFKQVHDLNEKLKQMSYEDPLTGIYNRRKLFEIIEYEVEAYFRNKRNFQLIMIDLNNFKAVNDSLGHVEGDRMLKEFALLLKTRIRKIDFSFRYGGDEFVVLLRDSPPPAASVVVERIKAGFMEKFKKEIEEFNFGFSYGFVEFGKFYSDLCNRRKDFEGNCSEVVSELFKAVDGELYSAKRKQ